MLQREGEFGREATGAGGAVWASALTVSSSCSPDYIATMLPKFIPEVFSRGRAVVQGSMLGAVIGLAGLNVISGRDSG